MIRPVKEYYRKRAVAAAIAALAAFVPAAAVTALQEGKGAVLESFSSEDESEKKEINAEKIEKAKSVIAESVRNRESRLLTGEKKGDDGRTYYYRSGALVKNQWVEVDGEFHRVGPDGAYVTGKYEDEHGTFMLDDSGRMYTGWVDDDGVWRYYDNGEMLVGGTYCLDDGSGGIGTYEFGEDGALIEDAAQDDKSEQEEQEPAAPPALSSKDDTQESFIWEKEKGTETISGLKIAGMPAEFYMLCIAGEVSGMANMNAIMRGDAGRAYGICQLDYRYDLVAFMNEAYAKHPKLWAGFADYLGFRSGSPDLRHNSTIGLTFLYAMSEDFETAVSDQLEFFRSRYWDGFSASLRAAGIALSQRSVAVQAAAYSINVNCGAQPSIFISALSASDDDETMIRKMYGLRNGVLARQKVGSVYKGSSYRYRKAEPQMALDMLYGYCTIDSNISYGGGVEWHGNPFSEETSTVATQARVMYEEAAGGYQADGAEEGPSTGRPDIVIEAVEKFEIEDMDAAEDGEAAKEEAAAEEDAGTEAEDDGSGGEAAEEESQSAVVLAGTAEKKEREDPESAGQTAEEESQSAVILAGRQKKSKQKNPEGADQTAEAESQSAVVLAGAADKGSAEADETGEAEAVE